MIWRAHIGAHITGKCCVDRWIRRGVSTVTALCHTFHANFYVWEIPVHECLELVSTGLRRVWVVRVRVVCAYIHRRTTEIMRGYRSAEMSSGGPMNSSGTPPPLTVLLVEDMYCTCYYFHLMRQSWCDSKVIEGKKIIEQQ